MLKSKCMLAAAIGMAIAALSLNAQACSTVVVGKDVNFQRFSTPYPEAA